MRSVSSRFRLRSQAWIVPRRVACSGSTLLTRKTLSRRSAIAAPTSFSAPPSPYISAVSIRFMPRSRPRRSAAISSLRRRRSSPMPQVPCPSAGTVSPHGSFASGTGCMASILIQKRPLALRRHACLGSSPGETWMAGTSPAILGGEIRSSAVRRPECGRGCRPIPQPYGRDCLRSLSRCRWAARR